MSPITHEEISTALFSMDRNKAPGLDGYTDGFFQTTWEIISPEICEAVMLLFSNGTLLRQLNSTLITIVAKKPNASKVTEFRPIALCNVLHKLIAKVLATRLQGVLPLLINAS